MASSTKQPKHDDRREHARYAVFAGNAEIREVIGRRNPRDRARIVNWSRGGLLLKVPSPRRKFIFFKQEPLIREDDLIRCVLRLPPHYNDIDIQGSVMRVERDAKEPDLLQVGVCFDGTAPDKIEAIATLLEPKKQSTRAPAAKKSQRLSSKSGRESQRAKLREADSIQLRNSSRMSRQSGRI
jgi:hypothetical protein